MCDVEMRESFGLPLMNLGVVETTLAEGRNQSGPSVPWGRVVLDELREVNVRAEPFLDGARVHLVAVARELEPVLLLDAAPQILDVFV